MIRQNLFLGAALSLVACGAGAACVESVPVSTPSGDFTLDADGTATHRKTGLMWMRCALGQSWNGGTCSGSAEGYTWQQALQAAKALNDAGGYAGRTDWRVPNIKELPSIVERQCVSPSINADAFPNTLASNFWSASPVAFNSDFAWFVDFGSGYVSGSYDKGYAGKVRLVRAGQ